MNSKEIIKSVIDFNNPPRIGLDFNLPNIKDIAWIPCARLVNPEISRFLEWGYYSELKAKVPGFDGEVRMDAYGNIYGRLCGRTKGECIRGALQDGWDGITDYKMPSYDKTYEEELDKKIQENSEKFLLGALPIAVFSCIRDIRRMDNALSDTILEEENVIHLLKKIEELGINLIDLAGKKGFDGVIVYDDWGTQNALLINPKVWRKIFKPVYSRLTAKAHQMGMKFFVHSCGYVYEVIEDFIEAGVDVLQFDQPELVGVEKLGREFGGRVTFWSPVDIQKILQTGNKELIESEARKMIKEFGKFKGGFIAKDYPSLDDIDVLDEWANWARNVFIAEGKY